VGVDAHFIHRCEIQRGVSQKDPYHNDAPPVWSTLASDVPCRLVLKAQRIFSTDTAQQVEITKYLLLLPAGTDITEDDRVVSLVDETGATDGPFGVLSVLPRRARAVRHISVELERIG
jgi:hypothetical protein